MQPRRPIHIRRLEERDWSCFRIGFVIELSLVVKRGTLQEARVVQTLEDRTG
jgi:hypothetical protein